jgi:hypothetical protein
MDGTRHGNMSPVFAIKLKYSAFCGKINFALLVLHKINTAKVDAIVRR